MDSSSLQSSALKTPYSTPIPGGLQPSKSITVKGSVNFSPERFKINLRSGSDIAFQIHTSFDVNTVARNTQVNGSWGPEETILPGAMPFSRSQAFLVTITWDDIGYKVVVNGQGLFYYNHRVRDLPNINVLEVVGDVQLTDVEV